MLYTIITDGKNSLFSTSYRPHGTVFKLVGISSKATNVTHNKGANLRCISFPEKENIKRQLLFFYKTWLGQIPIVPMCSAGPELSQVTSMSRSSVRRDAAHAGQRAIPVRYKQNPICIAPLPYMSPLHYYHIECPLPRRRRRCAAPRRSRKKGLSRCSAGMGLMGFRLPSGDDGDNCVLSISLRCATAFGCKDSMQLLLTCTQSMAVHFDLFLPIFKTWLNLEKFYFQFCPIPEEISTKLMCVNFYVQVCQAVFCSNSKVNP